jgi:hypothetical protein
MNPVSTKAVTSERAGSFSSGASRQKGGVKPEVMDQSRVVGALTTNPNTNLRGASRRTFDEASSRPTIPQSATVPRSSGR